MRARVGARVGARVEARVGARAGLRVSCLCTVCWKPAPATAAAPFRPGGAAPEPKPTPRALISSMITHELEPRRSTSLVRVRLRVGVRARARARARDRAGAGD